MEKSGRKEIVATEHGLVEVIEYDGGGRRIRSTTHGSGGSVVSVMEYEHDCRGNKVKETKRDADGSVYYWVEYEYGGGRVVKETAYNGSGTLWYRSEYAYEGNSCGGIVKETRYNADGTVKCRKESEYDTAGKKIKETEYKADGSVGPSHEWVYDEKGYKTREISTDYLGRRFETEYTYNSEGRLAMVYYGGLVNYSTYEYDENGTLREYTEYTVDDFILSRCTYDKTGMPY